MLLVKNIIGPPINMTIAAQFLPYSSHLKNGFLILFLLLSNTACERDAKPEKLSTLGGLTMGTTYTVKINNQGKALPLEKINSGIIDILAKVNEEMSTYIEDSNLSVINQSESLDWIPLSANLYQVIDSAIQISALTEGSFDITIGPLVNLWGFGPAKTEIVPDSSAINAALLHTGYQKIKLHESPPALQKTVADIYIDLSAIAKGYAVDLVAEYLEQASIENYMVEVGGEIRARGENEIGFVWRIGIEKPEAVQHGVERRIKLNNIAMATSGDYRNYFEEDGKRYSHTINPVDGMPVTHDLASVTVLHQSTAWADALATAFLVMGKDSAFTLATKQNYAVLFLQRTKDGYTESYTDSFTEYLLE
jgi:FAD:protein FMN transferase